MTKNFIIAALIFLLIMIVGIFLERCRASYKEGFENGQFEEGLRIFRAIDPFIKNAPKAEYTVVDKIGHSDYTLLIIETGDGRMAVWLR